MSARTQKTTKLYYFNFSQTLKVHFQYPQYIRGSTGAEDECGKPVKLRHQSHAAARNALIGVAGTRYHDTNEGVNHLSTFVLYYGLCAFKTLFENRFRIQ